MKVSIVIPTHNRANVIPRALDSVLKQTFTDFECLVVDDHSTDETENIVMGFVKNDSRFKYIKYEGVRNLQAVLNKGLAMASGEYIARIDDDDYWTDVDKLKKQIIFLEEHRDYLLVGSNASFFYQPDKILFKSNLPLGDAEIRASSLLQNNFISSTVVFLKSEASSLGGFREDVGLAGDYALWLGLGVKGKFCNMLDCGTAICLPEVQVASRRITRVKDSIHIIQIFRSHYSKYYTGLFMRYTILFYLYIFPQVLFFDRFLLNIKVRLFGSNRV